LRALVISDTHLGAWTGRDLLREEFFLARLAPALDGIDEVVLLGDLFDFLFGSVADSVDASAGLLALIAEKLPGKRFVFLAGNHDHHLVHRDEENRLEAALARGDTLRPDGSAAHEPPGPAFFQSFLEARMPGVEVEIAYPTYECTGVLCTHGHYLDPHARMAGSRGSRMLTRTLWGIAAGGPEEPKCEADYESVITLLTEWLYIAAQMPHGTHAQQNVFRAAQRATRFASAAKAPVRAARRAGAGLRERAKGADQAALPSVAHFDAVVREEAARQAREGPLPGLSPSHPEYPEPTVLSRSSPTEGALEAFSQVVANLGWDREADRIVFAHTHQPLDDVRATRGATRYWNSGCWIYEPDLSSRQAYARYCRYAWPGTAIVIDDSEPQPRLLELLADLNPLAGGPGLPEAPA
jgi:UDP-2,3-diacylglucosamine pyrophosphatase LpxH